MTRPNGTERNLTGRDTIDKDMTQRYRTRLEHTRQETKGTERDVVVAVVVVLCYS